VTLVSLSIQLFSCHASTRRGGAWRAADSPIIVAVATGAGAGADPRRLRADLHAIRWIKVAENSVDYSLMNTTRQASSSSGPRREVRRQDGHRHVLLALRRLIQALAIYVGSTICTGRAEVRAAEPGAGARVDCARRGDRPGLQPQGARKRHERRARGGRGNSDWSFRRASRSCIPFADRVPGRDPGDVLHLRACCDDGKPLPPWVRFDARQRAFIARCRPTRRLTSCASR